LISITLLSSPTSTGDFALTATAIARQVGIITTPLSACHRISDLPPNTPVDQIANYRDTKEPGEAMSSIVLSGSELDTMTVAQWKRLLTVNIRWCVTLLLLTSVPVTSPVRRDCVFSNNASAKIADRSSISVVRFYGSCNRRWRSVHFCMR
jgi:hypothetical protein